MQGPTLTMCLLNQISEPKVESERTEEVNSETIEQFPVDRKHQEASKLMNHQTILQSKVCLKMIPPSPQLFPNFFQHTQKREDIHQNLELFRHQDNSTKRDMWIHFKYKRPSFLQDMETLHSNLVRIQSSVCYLLKQRKYLVVCYL